MQSKKVTNTDEDPMSLIALDKGCISKPILSTIFSKAVFISSTITSKNKGIIKIVRMILLFAKIIAQNIPTTKINRSIFSDKSLYASRNPFIDQQREFNSLFINCFRISIMRIY